MAVVAKTGMKGREPAEASIRAVGGSSPRASHWEST